MSSSPGDAETLDLRGETCPYTFVYTRLRLEGMALGSELVILLDHRPALTNVPRSAREWGQEVVEVEGEGEAPWHIRLRKRVE